MANIVYGNFFTIYLNNEPQMKLNLTTCRLFVSFTGVFASVVYRQEWSTTSEVDPIFQSANNLPRRHAY